MAYGSFNAGPGKAPDEDVVRTNQIGVPGGIATLDADGHLTESQRPTVDAYTKAQTDQKSALPSMPTTLQRMHTATSAPAWPR